MPSLAWVYIIGFIISAGVIGAFAVPASANHKGHPADDPMLAIFLAFIWPVGLLVLAIGIPLFVAAGIGAGIREIIVRRLPHG